MNKGKALPRWIVSLTLFLGFFFIESCSLIEKRDGRSEEPIAPGQVAIRWEASPDLRGFNVYRRNPDGEEVRANGRLVAPVSRTPSSRGLLRYEFIDRGVIAGYDYYYTLEEISPEGMARRWETPRLETAIPLEKTARRPAR